MNRFLVFSSVGHKNNVRHWTSGKVKRNFDLVFYYYEEDEPPTFEADMVVKRKGFKFDNFAHFLDHNDVSNYEAIWLLDDDMIIDKRSINKLFKAFIKHDLWLAQPSINQGQKNIPFPFQRHDPTCILKYTNFVEVNAAVIRTDKMGLIAQTFRDSRNCGFGLDFIWVKLLGFPEDKIAIINTVICEHPYLEVPAIEEVYTRDEMKLEGIELLIKYGLLENPNEPITTKHWKLPYKVTVYREIKKSNRLSSLYQLLRLRF